MKRSLLGYVCIIVSILFLIAGCSSEDNAVQEHEQKDIHLSHAENGDLREMTASADTLPNFLSEKPEDLKIIYAAAAGHQNLLEYIPCYCGCAEAGNHKNNYDCFIHENKKNGKIVWDDHGTRCQVCLEIAAESMIQYKAGKTVKEIRQYIDEKYKEGYASPTPTPMPDQL